MTKNVLALLSLSALPAGATNSQAVNTKGATRLVAHQRMTASSGTSPTLDTKLQDSPDGTNWYDISGGAFTQVTGAGPNSQRLALVGPFGPFVRTVSTVGGSNTPTETAEIYLTIEVGN